MLLQCLVQHVIYLIHLEVVLELADSSVLVNLHILNAKHLCEVLPVLLGDVVGESTVVCATSENPCACTNLEGWLWNPKSGCHRKVWPGLWLDALYLLRDKTEAVAEVNNSSLDAATNL